MTSLTPYVWAWGKSVVRLLAAMTVISVASAAPAAEVLFPQPLHLTRRIEDPVSHSTTTVDEYCAGNQVVTVSRDKVTISDHARQELTEIDRAAGTYSITSFADLASALSATSAPLSRRGPAMTEATNAAPHERWTVARNNEAFDVTFAGSPSAPAKMEVRFDRNVRVSKAALEVLIGAAFPNPRTDVHDALIDIARRRTEGGDRRIAANAVPEELYALPVEQSVTFDAGGGETITLRSTVLDVRPELVPQGTLIIPPGARLVESHAVRLARELREVDQLPNPPRQ